MKECVECNSSFNCNRTYPHCKNMKKCLCPSCYVNKLAKNPKIVTYKKLKVWWKREGSLDARIKDFYRCYGYSKEHRQMINMVLVVHAL